VEMTLYEKPGNRFPHYHRHDDDGDEWKSPKTGRFWDTHSKGRVITIPYLAFI
jgi:hypothetical protein